MDGTDQRSFFTQTKPLQPARKDSEISSDLLAGSSILLDDNVVGDQAAGYDLSSTQRGTSEAEVGEGEHGFTRRPETPAGHSLAATEGDDEMDEDEDDAEDEEETDKTLVATQPQPIDAFARLMSAGQKPLSEHQKRSKRLIRSNLVDEQAEESEDDDNWMLPGQKSDDEEEGEGEDDAYLADLVNDEAMDEEEKRKQDALVAAKARYVPTHSCGNCP